MHARRVEAVILAGGLGSRLRPLTDRHPKHVLPVAGLPFLAHQLARLAAAGVEHVVLAASYRADEVAAVFGDGSGYGVRLTYVREREPARHRRRDPRRVGAPGRPGRRPGGRAQR